VRALEGEIVTRTAAAYGHTLCVTATGQLYSWGSGHGLLGLEDTEPRRSPTQVTLLAGMEIIDIACG
jgi:alpha-tubulin suppressor-like RCC1 family protein